jgi:hypothetical protein
MDSSGEIPAFINDYNHNMSGVNTADQLRSCYQTHGTSVDLVSLLFEHSILLLLTPTLFMKTVHKLLTSRIKTLECMLNSNLIWEGIEIKVDITRTTQESISELGLASLFQTTKIPDHN